ncbi:hypothetical protein RHSIM_Rhsim03G0036800 [Rhododendron simsii]|uniref:Small acidic protein-like domain-containing protein n=1 Tax=Rhododendron simsii TaxID=118357 RepID=A0A834LPZ4_RHOSS|nr:hypothetical protein RHSIM_Rhsim03G0036800 [Rhododendron simsii]
MESKTLSPSPDNADAKAAFRKPSNDAANRKYRRRSPVSGSSSSDGSPTREHSSSPIYSRDNPTRDSESWRRNGNRRDLEKDSGRSYRGRSGDSYRNSDRQSSRSSHNYHRRDDYSRHEKHRDDTRRESEHYRSRDPSRGDDKYSRYRSDGSGNRSRDKDKGDGGGRDEKREHRRSLGDYKGDLSPVYGEYLGNRNDSTSRRDVAKRRSKEASNSDPREFDGHKYTKEEKKKFDDQETSRPKDWSDRAPGEQFEDKSAFTSENHEYSAKKPKLESSSTEHGKVSKFSTVADEKLPSSSKQVQELVGKVTSEEAPAKGSEVANDFDAAKIAAMKAAELDGTNATILWYKHPLGISPVEMIKHFPMPVTQIALEEDGNRVDFSSHRALSSFVPQLLSLKHLLTGLLMLLCLAINPVEMIKHFPMPVTQIALEEDGNRVDFSSHRALSSFVPQLLSLKHLLTGLLMLLCLAINCLFNKNLIGTGYMSADQKKKLLWGNKKNTAAEESGHRWDATLFPDRERQEKFNKLMGVKGEVKAAEHKPDNQETSGLQAEKQMEQLQLELEKQYTAGLRRRDGRTVGLGL